MDIRMHAATAAIAVVCGSLAGFGVSYTVTPKEKIVDKQVQTRSALPSKRTWPDLTMDETIAIGEALKEPLKGGSVSILCNDSLCDDLAHDLDDAMQIADVGSTLDRSALPLGRGFYIVSNAEDGKAKVIADAIKQATSGKLAPEVRHGKVAGMTIAIGNQPRR